MKLRRFITILCAAVLWAFAAGARTYAVDEVPDVHRADRSAFVADPDRYISDADMTVLNGLLENVRRSTSVEPMIAVVGAIPDDTDIDTYATGLFDRWGLGKDDKDNGLLIVVAVDNRRMAIRTGYGLEGVLPDITCGRIIRDTLRPAFRTEHYGAGLIAATRQISKILTDPAYAEELASERHDADDAAGAAGDVNPFRVYMLCSCGLAAIMLIVLLCSCLALRGRSDYDKYRSLAPSKPVWLILGFIGLGIPFVATIPYILLLNHWRNHRRDCPHCGARMIKVDEVNDNNYLTPAQDLEERLGSVDYDVWLCPECGETDVLPYVNSSSSYIECDNCHARAARLVNERILRRPSGTRKGYGVKEYECLNCRHRQQRPFYFEGSDSSVLGAMAAGAILGGSGRGHGGGFSGGSFGGGFGGGMTGGGGASGGW